MAGLLESSSPQKGGEGEAGLSGGAVIGSDKIFALLGAYFEQATAACAALRKKVNCLFHFEILRPEGEPRRWSVDLRLASGEGSAGKAAASPPVSQGFVGGNADATFSLSDADFTAVCTGTLNPQVAYLQGKMKIRGSISKATLFTPSLFPPISASVLSLPVQEAVKSFLAESALGEKASQQTPGVGVAPEGDSIPPLSAAASKCKSAALYPHIRRHLNSEAGKTLAPKVN